MLLSINTTTLKNMFISPAIAMLTVVPFAQAMTTVDRPSSDHEDMKRRLQNTVQVLDRAAEAHASRTEEGEELD